MISSQPRSRSLNDPERVDPNGEQIVIEAVCDVDNLQTEVRNTYIWSALDTNSYGAGVLVLLCWLGISIPLGCYCGKRVANSWRLFLTNSSIHHVRKHHCCLCSSANTDVHIKLSDVSAVSLKMALGETVCCSSPKQLPTTVVVTLKPGRRLDLLPHWCLREGACLDCLLGRRRINNDTTVIFRFTHCANAEDFVKAVNQQMADIQA